MKINNEIRDDLLRKEIGARLTNMRVLRGVTQAELAKRSGISRFCLSRLENGEGGISFDSVLSVFRQLGVLSSINLLLPEPRLPLKDMVAETAVAKPLPKRVRKSRKPSDGGRRTRVWGDGTEIGGR